MARSSGGGGGHSSSHSSSSFSSSRSSHSFSSSSSSSHRSNYSRSSHSNYSPSIRQSPPRSSRPIYHNHYYHSNPYYGGRPIRRSGCLTSTVSFVVVVIILIVIFQIFSMSHYSYIQYNIPNSTVNREKIEGYSYNDIIIDNTGELSRNHSQLSKALRDFYNKTGIVPIIYLADYSDYKNINIALDTIREQYANEVFDEYAKHEASFLVMCFESEPDMLELDYTMTIVGHNADSVLDSEALNIFEAYFRQAWDNESLSMDEVFIQAFNNTANRIMQKNTTGKDVANSAFKVLTVIVFIAGVIILFGIIRKHQKQKHEEIQQILNTPLDNHDSTLDKYE